MRSPKHHAQGIVTRASPRPVGDTVARLLEILRTKNIRVFVVIGQREEARKVGLDLSETVLVVCGSPSAGTPIMDHSPLAAADLPMKVLIWDNNGETEVSYVAPSELVRRFSLPSNLRENLAGIDSITDALVAST